MSDEELAYVIRRLRWSWPNQGAYFKTEAEEEYGNRLRPFPVEDVDRALDWLLAETPDRLPSLGAILRHLGPTPKPYLDTPPEEDPWDDPGHAWVEHVEAFWRYRRGWRTSCKGQVWWWEAGLPQQVYCRCSACGEGWMMGRGYLEDAE